MEKGTAPTPKLTLAAEGKDYMDVVTGKVNAMSAFSAGQAQAQGGSWAGDEVMNFFKLPA